MKQINGLEDYFIDELGEVFSYKSGQKVKMKPSKHLNGYLFFQFRKDGKYIYKSHHRLVAEHFLNDWDEFLHVNHINGVKDDNRIENLEMCTKSENMLHAQDTGLWPNIGTDHYRATLTSHEVLFIRELVKLKTMSQRIIGMLFGVRQQVVCDLMSKTYRNVI